ncbi:3'(2'),5'-bisphosphate nucleotidase [Catenovulum agarivorans DS-2]|uniref:3'(2'),5'-bisphosphate nucleotidase CysQ n=1 Tax=Catenovulum agarivorans DS-2 TaxID=1328313 RepID=W7QB03_9ALTE|nr:3'(2'),5'-bisphosphate nucleotidase CysQ [Catenovulum agarivorans]EWH10034.1 3'(2'),5'-bisphosphate nucleotidase [Catenovulum agarivorans DS-2]
MKPDPAELLDDVKKIAFEAGEAIMAIYQQGEFDLYQKDDESPVTSADYAANEVLTKALQKLTPSIPILSEESCEFSFSERKQWQAYWLLDPMDGTQEFVSRSGDFAVNIALVVDGQPVLGVIYWPTQHTWYYAASQHGAFKQVGQNIEPIQVTQYATEGFDEADLRLAVSRVQKSNTVGQYLVDAQQYKTVALGSCSLKSCMIAEGRADFYLRVGPTGEWDTGASHCILREAGGNILDSEFNALSYNQRETLANPDFIVIGDSKVDWKKVIIPHKTQRTL